LEVEVNGTDDALLNASEDDLLIEIGKRLTLEETGFLPPNLKAMGERGRRYVAAQTEKLRATVCSSNAVRSAADSGSQAELVSAVAGAIESIVAGTSLTPLAILLSKRGLQNFCEREWN
jgi:hypothetical protein